MFNFAASPPEWQPGELFLGIQMPDSQTAWRVGLKTERHLLTVAGSRSGKGAALIIPNLLRWPDNALVIDPKGENAEVTAEIREKLFGQSVHVLDPFGCSNVPDRLRASFNPFDALDPAAPTIREDIKIIAESLVIRHKAEDSLWDDGTVAVLSGFIAHILTQAPPDRRNLLGLRHLFQLTGDARQALFADMADNPACGGLACSAGSIGLNASRKNAEFIDSAARSTDWLDSPAMQDTFSRSTFDLADLKTGKTTIYLVLPPAYIGEHGRFLRLFVKLAINAMSKGQGGAQCLFLLDEFFALGRLDEVAKAAGLLPSYGVHLWPFLQDLGQLVSLYGKEGAETFFGNADAHIFFGNTDPYTLGHISDRLGTITLDEVSAPPHLAVHQATAVPLPFSLPSVAPVPKGGLNLLPQLNMARHQNTIHQTTIADANARALIDTQNREALQTYQHEKSRIGRPRLAPDDVRELIAKKGNNPVARSMIVFAKGREVYRLFLSPWFLRDGYSLHMASEDQEAMQAAERAKQTEIRRYERQEIAAMKARDARRFNLHVKIGAAFSCLMLAVIYIA